MRRFLLLLIIPLALGAQSIVGEWDSYTSALTLNQLVRIDETIYAASPGGLIEFDKSENCFKVYGPNDGLSYIDIRSLALDKFGDLWLGMSSPHGEINIWDPVARQVTAVFNAAQFGEDLTAIGAMTFDSDLGFIAYQENVDWGVLYFKIDGEEYTYRDFLINFPVNFSTINHLEIIHDTLWVATDVGLLFGDLRNDLKNSDNWTAVNLPGSGNVSGVVVYDGAVLCSYGTDVYRVVASRVSLFSNLSSSIIQLTLDASEDLYAATLAGIYRYNGGAWIKASSSVVNDILTDPDGAIWGATSLKGLLKVTEDGDDYYVPNTIVSNGNTALCVNEDGRLVAASSRGISFQTANGWYNLVKDYNYIGLNDHTQVNWNYYVSDTIAFSLPDGSRIYSLIKRGDEYFASLFGSYLNGLRGGGLLRFNLDDLENYVVYDTTYGKLTASAGYGGADNYLAVGLMALDGQNNLWIANQFSQNDSCIAVLTADDRWVHFGGEESGNYLNYLITSIVFDAAGRVWFGSETATSPAANGGIAVLDYNNTLFDKSDDHWYRISTSQGLASNDVFGLAFDQENKLWIMSSGGIQSATISDNFPASYFSGIDDATLTNISFAKECRIKVDGLNNKWITTVNAGVKVYTYNGVWLNDVEGFTTENSGLLSDNILDIAFYEPKGLVFISTNKGISVYRSPYAYYGNKYKKARVFPSPFLIPADTPLTIDDLLQESEVKIMLLDGTFIRHLDALDGEVAGQQAFWDGRNEKGKLVSSGVYIYVAYTPEGDTMTGKIAVVRK